MIEQSALTKAVVDLKQSGYTIEQLIDARLTPEQARDRIWLHKGIHISAGALDFFYEMYRRECQKADVPLRDKESVFDVVCDFQADALGAYHTKHTGIACAPRTEMRMLIEQRG